MAKEYDFTEPLEAARSELETLLNEESNLESRLQHIRERSETLRNAIINLSVLVGEDEHGEEQVGITDAIRDLLRESEKVWAPIIVRVRLKKKGFPLDKYKNPLAVIHTTLKRLEEQGEVESVEKNGKTYYKWTGGVTDDDIPF